MVSRSRNPRESSPPTEIERGKTWLRRPTLVTQPMLHARSRSKDPQLHPLPPPYDHHADRSQPPSCPGFQAGVSTTPQAAPHAFVLVATPKRPPRRQHSQPQCDTASRRLREPAAAASRSTVVAAHTGRVRPPVVRSDGTPRPARKTRSYIPSANNDRNRRNASHFSPQPSQARKGPIAALRRASAAVSST